MTQQDQTDHVELVVQTIETATGKTANRMYVVPEGLSIIVIFPDDEEHRAAIRQGMDSPEVAMMGTTLHRSCGEVAFVVPGGWH